MSTYLNIRKIFEVPKYQLIMKKFALSTVFALSIVFSLTACDSEELSNAVSTAGAAVSETVQANSTETAEEIAFENTVGPTVTASTADAEPVDQVSLIDSAMWVNESTQGSFWGVNQNECVEALLIYLGGEDSKGTGKGYGPSVRYLSYLVSAYVREFPDDVDCSDPSRLWEEIQDWTTKLNHVPIPKPDIRGSKVRPLLVDGEYLQWSERITVALPRPEPGDIFAFDIDSTENPAQGTPWLFDRVEYAWTVCDSREWTEVETASYAFTYEAKIWLEEYDPDHKDLCIYVNAKYLGVDIDGFPSEFSVSTTEQILLRPYEDYEDRFVVLGFGDSYGSGEGNPALGHLSAGTDHIWWDDDNWPEAIETFTDNATYCHRSSESGLGKAIQQLEASYTGSITFGHFACSGAKSWDIWSSSYQPDFYDGTPTMDPQILQALDWLSEINTSPAEVDAIVVSIGGNDVGFSQVIKDCFILSVWPSECHDGSWGNAPDLMDSIPTLIPRAVSHVSHVAGLLFPNAEIFFTFYTDGISVDQQSGYDEDGDGVCSYDDDPWGWEDNVEFDDDEFWDITRDDSKFVRDFLVRINSQLAITANDVRENGSLWDEYWPWDHLGAGAQHAKSQDLVAMYPELDGWEWRSSGLPLIGRVHVTVPQYTLYQNNGFCTRDRRNIMFNTEAGDIQGYDLGFWSSGGWHPNDLGYSLYGNAIAEDLSAAFPEGYQNLRVRR